MALLEVTRWGSAPKRTPTPLLPGRFRSFSTPDEYEGALPQPRLHLHIRDTLVQLNDEEHAGQCGHNPKTPHNFAQHFVVMCPL